MQIGVEINAHKVWGDHFLADLSHDLQSEYPGTRGYSERNLKYMAKFAALFTEKEIVQEALAQFPWYHVITLIDKVKDLSAFLWYADVNENECFTMVLSGIDFYDRIEMENEYYESAEDCIKSESGRSKVRRRKCLTQKNVWYGYLQ